MAQRFAMGALLVLLAACTIPIQTVTFKGTRTERFLYGVAYYQKVSDDKHKLVFEEGEFDGHSDYCAWVVRDPYLGDVVGLNNKNPRCQEYKPEWLALHEVCHLRMAHLEVIGTLSHEKRESEVVECMRAYDARVDRRTK